MTGTDRVCACGCGGVIGDSGRPNRPTRFCVGHRVPVFWAKVDKNAANGCWVWTGCKQSPDSYGVLQVRKVRKLAHRYAYELLVGPIPEGLQLDHLCRNVACVNPSHLEPVTPRENCLRGESHPARNARKTHCIHGHPLSGANVQISRSGYRRCLVCRGEESRRRNASLKDQRRLKREGEMA